MLSASLQDIEGSGYIDLVTEHRFLDGFSDGNQGGQVNDTIHALCGPVDLPEIAYIAFDQFRQRFQVFEVPGMPGGKIVEPLSPGSRIERVFRQDASR